MSAKPQPLTENQIGLIFCIGILTIVLLFGGLVYGCYKAAGDRLDSDTTAHVSPRP